MITVAGRLPPGWLPSFSTLRMPAVAIAVNDLSNRPSSVLMTAVALFIWPSQKNSSRAGACWAVLWLAAMHRARTIVGA